jgi:hypothetical protein
MPAFRPLPALFVLLFAAALATAPAAAQPADLPEHHLHPAETERHLRFLASDELMGRAPGTPGGQAAARYIAEHFREVGLAPLSGADGYYQPVPLVRTAPPAHGEVRLLDQTFRQGERMLLLSGDALEAEAPVVFAGYGTAAEYEGLDAQGKVVVVRFGLPGEANPMAGFQAGAAKRQQAAARGAVALVELYRAAFPWPNLVAFLNRPRVGLDDGDSAFPHASLDDADGTLAAQLAQDAEAHAAITTPGLTRQAVTSPNVVGLVEGGDPARRDEYVLLTAHYDHVGAGMDKPGATPADSIFNGARDNGMGTVALLNAAEALAAAPPARSVVFIAYAAEESGLLGSQYYAEHPLVPLERSVFALNVDTGGYSDTTIVTVIGMGRTTADAAIQQGAAAFGLQAAADPSPEQNLFDRSDNVSLARKGVPAPTFTPGFRSFTDEGVAQYYHQPADEADEHFDFAYLHRFSQAYAHAARRLADLAEPPRWVAGDKYEPAAQALYGTPAPAGGR